MSYKLHKDVPARYLISTGEDGADWDGNVAHKLLVNPLGVESGLNVDTGLVGITAAQAERQDSGQAAVAVQPTTDVSWAHRLSHQRRGSSARKNSSAQHRLFDASGICQVVAVDAVYDRGTDDHLVSCQNDGSIAAGSPSGKVAVSQFGDNAILQDGLLNHVVGQVDGVGEAQYSQVVVVGDRVELVMGEDVGDGAHLTTTADDEETVVATSDAQAAGVDHSRSDGVDDAACGGEEVAGVEQSGLAVQMQGSVQGALRGILTDRRG